MISVTNLDLGYQQCLDLNDLLRQTGGSLISQLESNVDSLKILLPINLQNKPDYKFMENYIKALPYGDRL